MKHLYKIGNKYKYPNSKKIFTLKKVKKFVYIFECGHWCTDLVFGDLIDLSNKKQVYKNIQLTLF